MITTGKLLFLKTSKIALSVTFLMAFLFEMAIFVAIVYLFCMMLGIPLQPTFEHDIQTRIKIVFWIMFCGIAWLFNEFRPYSLMEQKIEGEIKRLEWEQWSQSLNY